MKELKLKVRKITKSRKGMPIGVNLLLIDSYGAMSTGYMKTNGVFITDNEFMNDLTHYVELPDWVI